MEEFKTLNTKQMAAFLGLGRNTVLHLCQTKLDGFPAIRVGNRYRADIDLLKAWRDRLYRGEITL
jgi:hypothetical protein